MHDWLTIVLQCVRGGTGLELGVALVGCTLSSKIRIQKAFKFVEPYIDRARQGADMERNALGFLPPNAYRQAAEQGKLFIAVDAADLYLGHLMFGGVFPHGKVQQIYCTPEFRRYGVAKALMNELVNYAQDRAYLSLSAKVASDLSEANDFYERMGFHAVSTHPGGKTRGRLLYRRVRDLDTPSLFDLMAPKKREHLPSLGIYGSYSTKTPIYAVDLNVLFDVSKQRGRSEDAGTVMNAGFRNDIRLVITKEFINELERTTDKFPNDPYLQIALKMNVLPTPKLKDISAIEKNLARVIFPDRSRQGILTAQDKSDIRHLATAIFHKIAGFITSEKALLRAHEYLQFEYGLDILGVSDFADAMSSDDDENLQNQVARTNETDLSSRPLSDSNYQAARSFLAHQRVPQQAIKYALSRGDYVNPHSHVVVSGGSDVISFATWNIWQNPRKMANVFLYANESSPAVKTAIDHTLSRICSGVSYSAPARICLNVLPGHPVTKSIALAHGFRPEPGQEEHATALHKVAVGDAIDEQSWGRLRQILKSLVGVELRSTIPTYKGPYQRITVKTTSGQDEAIPLQELEALLSPALILLPGRPGTVVSIKRIFADELLGTSEQLSLLTPPEAGFLKNRVYYNTPRAASILAPGTPILFYESSEGGGRKSIIAVGRTTASHVISDDKVNPDTKRRGVLDAGGLKHIGASKSKLVTSFDNIMVFKKPVSLGKLREIGCADGANFVTAKQISSHHLIEIIREGLKNG